MANSSFAGANIDYSANGTSTWTDLCDDVNSLKTAVATEVLTISANSTGAVTTGNASVDGILNANTLAVGTALRGGSVATPGVLTITTNTSFSANVSVLDHMSVVEKLVANNVSISANGIETTANLVVSTAGEIDVSNAVISNVADPISNTDAVNYGFLLSIGSIFKTVNQLQTANVSSTVEVVSVAGYYDEDDGGGALYVRAASEPSHGMKIQDGDLNWWEIAKRTVVSVLQAGAKPLGNTADANTNSTAFDTVKNYLDSEFGGGIMFIPRGEYNLYSTFSVDVNNINVRGEGAEATKLNFSTQTSGAGCQWLNANNCSIEDVSISGSFAASLRLVTASQFSAKGVQTANTRATSVDIDFNAVTTASLDKCKFFGGPSLSSRNVHVRNGSKNIGFNQIHVQNGGTSAIDIDTVNQISFNNILVENSGGIGIDIDDAENITMVNVEVANCVSSGMFIEASANNTTRVSIDTYYGNGNGTTSGDCSFQLVDVADSTIYMSLKNVRDTLPSTGTVSSVSRTGSGEVYYTVETTEFSGTTDGLEPSSHDGGTGTGSYEIRGNTLECWGWETTAANGTANVAYPRAFKTGTVPTFTATVGTGTNSDGGLTLNYAAVSDITTNAFVVTYNSAGGLAARRFYWRAIGEYDGGPS